MTFWCTITGLDPDEKADEIKFGHLPKCDHNQLQTNEINILNYTLSNGTIGELHIPNANASHNGDYHCRVKIHTQTPNECMLVKTPAKTVDIEDDVQDSVPPTDSDSTSPTVKIITGFIATVIICTIIIVVLTVLLFVKKCKRKQQVHNQPELQQVHNQPELERSVHNQPELEQSVEVEEHVQEHLPLLQSKSKTHWYINASTKVCMCAHYYREYRQVQHYSQKFLPATEKIFTLLFWPLLS